MTVILIPKDFLRTRIAFIVFHPFISAPSPRLLGAGKLLQVFSLSDDKSAFDFHIART